MSDLISRSALMSLIESEHRQWGDDYDVEQILGDIEDMSTAYDIDKVVEQLEIVSVAEPITYNGVKVGTVKVLPLREAIEIVKGG